MDALGEASSSLTEVMNMAAEVEGEATEGEDLRVCCSRLRIYNYDGVILDFLPRCATNLVCCVCFRIVSAWGLECKCRRRWQIGNSGREKGKLRGGSKRFSSARNLDNYAMEQAGNSRGPARHVLRRSSHAGQWPPPPSTPHPFPNAERIVLEWGHRQGASVHKLDILAALLRRSYLLDLSLPRGFKGFTTSEELEPRQLRYLFRRHSARLLGWRRRFEEGDPRGFSEEVNQAIRSEVYPDV